METQFSQSKPTQSERRRLVIRLSSLGDVVLATAALAELEGQVDWVVSRDFAPILEGHPKIRKLWAFDRSTGFAGWCALISEIRKINYEEVYDLHRSLRSRLLVWALRVDGARIGCIRKERWRLRGYFIFKKYWPKPWRPLPWVNRFARVLGGPDSGRPDLSYLCTNVNQTRVELPSEFNDRGFIAVMPSSRWPGKTWPIESYVSLLNQWKLPVVILGGPNDALSFLLGDHLINKRREFPVMNAVGQFDLRQTAQILSRARYYLGADTGLAHIAEAVGTPSRIIYGPTIEDQGFGPWRKESMALGRRDLGCRPCSKDGRICFRIWDRYACLKGLSADEVQAQSQRESRL